MLRIAHLTHFAAGARRCCFVHPHDPGKCVKVLHSQFRPEVVRKTKVWYKRYLHPLARFDISRLEFGEIQRLAKVGGQQIWRHIPRHFGFVETDLGTAAVVELIRNPDGSPAPTLADLIRRGEIPQQALDEFRRFLRTLVLPHWGDCGPDNVVFAPPQSSEMGGRLVVVDGLCCSKLRILKSHLMLLRNHRTRERARECCGNFEKHLTAYIRDASG